MKITILNKEQLEQFNKNYNANFKSVMIEQDSNKYYAILDCDVKVQIKKNDADKYISYK